MEMFLTLVLQVVLAVVVAKLTLAGSRSQKWWERKADLYANLIESLYDIRSFHSDMLEHCMENPSALSAEAKKQRDDDEEALSNRTKKAEHVLEKLTHTGTFLISDKVHQDLLAFKKAERKAWEENDRYDTYSIADDIVTAAEKCMDSVREHAKDDLGQNGRFGWFKRLWHKALSFLSE